MAVTTVYTYDLNGSKKDFDVPFEYLARRFVQVTLIGQDRKPLDLASDFRFIGKTSIQTLKAWGPADGYERIEIRRNTSATDRLVDFADGSILRANELNTSQVQTLHVAEEARNMVADTIAVNQDGDLDARGRRLVNLADATEAGHAVTLRQTESWAESALNSMRGARSSEINAKASESAAKASEINAKSSESAAKGSEARSKASEVSSKASEVASKSSETNSRASEIAAKTSEMAAKTSETNSKASEIAAKAWASTLNLPSSANKELQVLRQRSDGAGLEYVPSHFHFGLGGLNARVYGDLNDIRSTGFYMGASLINAPVSSGEWFYVIHQEHGAAGYRSQLAFRLTGYAHQMWGRICNSGTWSAWSEHWTTATLSVGATGRVLAASGDAASARDAIGAAERKRRYMKREVVWTGLVGNATTIGLTRPIQNGELIALSYSSFPYNGNAIPAVRGDQHSINFGSGGDTTFRLSGDGSSITWLGFTNGYPVTQVSCWYVEE